MLGRRSKSIERGRRDPENQRGSDMLDSLQYERAEPEPNDGHVDESENDPGRLTGCFGVDAREKTTDREQEDSDQQQARKSNLDRPMSYGQRADYGEQRPEEEPIRDRDRQLGRMRSESQFAHQQRAEIVESTGET